MKPGDLVNSYYRKFFGAKAPRTGVIIGVIWSMDCANVYFPDKNKFELIELVWLRKVEDDETR
jgi:hypothetical protein